MEQKKKTLKERFFERATQLHRAWSTAECYWGWAVKFIRWHWQKAGGRDTDWPKVDPLKLGVPEVERRVSQNTQNQNLQAA